MVLWCFPGENCGKTHIPQHNLLRNLQSEQVALSTQTVSVGELHIAASFPTKCCVFMGGKQAPTAMGICPGSPVMPQESLYTSGLSLRSDVRDGALIKCTLVSVHHDVISKL